MDDSPREKIDPLILPALPTPSPLPSWAERLTDGLNPVAVREVRRMTRNWLFWPVLVCLPLVHLCTLLLTGMMGWSVTVLGAMLLIETGILALVIPITLDPNAESQAPEQDADLAETTPLITSEVILGKFQALLLPAALVVVSGLPGLGFTALLPGVSPWNLIGLGILGLGPLGFHLLCGVFFRLPGKAHAHRVIQLSLWFIHLVQVFPGLCLLSPFETAGVIAPNGIPWGKPGFQVGIALAALWLVILGRFGTGVAASATSLPTMREGPRTRVFLCGAWLVSGLVHVACRWWLGDPAILVQWIVIWCVVFLGCLGDALGEENHRAGRWRTTLGGDALPFLVEGGEMGGILWAASLLILTVTFPVALGLVPLHFPIPLLGGMITLLGICLQVLAFVLTLSVRFRAEVHEGVERRSLGGALLGVLLLSLSAIPGLATVLSDPYRMMLFTLSPLQFVFFPHAVLPWVATIGWLVLLTPWVIPQARQAWRFYRGDSDGTREEETFQDALARFPPVAGRKIPAEDGGFRPLCPVIPISSPWLGGIEDRLNPVLVMELRKLAGSRAVATSLVLLLLAMSAIATWVILEPVLSGDGWFGRSESSAGLAAVVVLLFWIGALVPYGAASRFKEEWDQGLLDHDQLWCLSPARFMAGKLQTHAVLCACFLSASLPFLILIGLLGRIPLSGLLLLVVLSTPVLVIGHLLAYLMPILDRRLPWAGFVLKGMVALFLIQCPAIVIAVDSMKLASPAWVLDAVARNEMSLLLGAGWYLFLVLLLFRGIICAFPHHSGEGLFRLRSLLTVAWLGTGLGHLAVAMQKGLPDAIMGWMMGWILFLAGILPFVAAEGERESRSGRVPGLSQNRGWFIFSPGPAAGVTWGSCLLLSTPLGAVLVWKMLPWDPPPPLPGGMLLWAWAALQWVSAALCGGWVCRLGDGDPSSDESPDEGGAWTRVLKGWIWPLTLAFFIAGFVLPDLVGRATGSFFSSAIAWGAGGGTHSSGAFPLAWFGLSLGWLAVGLVLNLRWLRSHWLAFTLQETRHRTDTFS